MEQYTSKSTSELRKKLREYGYRGYTTMDKDQLINSAFVVDMEQKFVKNFKPTPIDFTQFSKGRCNANRHQRFVSETDMKILKTILFSGMIEGVNFKINDVREYIWTAVYIKKNTDDVYIHSLLKLTDGYYFYFDIQLQNDDKITYRIAKDKNHANIVNNIMTNEQYYWYRYNTELQYQIDLVRDLNMRTSLDISKKLNDILYLYYKINESEEKAYQHIKIMKIQNSDDLRFDYLKNVKKLFWVHLNYTSNDKSYLLYQNSENTYVLIKFSFDLKVIEDIPHCHLNMIKVYLSDNYSDLIQKGLINKEYEMYINETIVKM
jgi:hypothetical protein